MGILPINPPLSLKPFKQSGFKLNANQYGVDVQVVYTLASLLGPDEDFDGLVVEVEDYSWQQ